VPPEPAALLGVLVVGALYARGVAQLWQRAGHAHGVHLWQTACFAGGLLAIVVALETPLDTLSQELFAIHMAQHLLAGLCDEVAQGGEQARRHDVARGRRYLVAHGRASSTAGAGTVAGAIGAAAPASSRSGSANE